MDKHPKIALIGTSCVGKTTLFEHYKTTSGGRLNTSAEVARWYLRGIPDERKFTYVIQAGLQDAIIRQEQEVAAGSGALTICDRSVLDPVSYLQAWGDNLDARKLLDRIRHWLPTYTYFFLLEPADVAYFNDDVRTENEAVRDRMHETFRELLKENSIPYEPLEGTLEERIAVVDRKISSLLD